ncbi:hypothetical protein BA1DRAFT_03405 [Photorhabdus aegyptia]|uniref:Uncharacterized protein n=1 Tax=Photorhabdus aegyptia TaxID=2805098 RepID=A0A022PEF7_9GAMM|nr:hypothetical protein BA1DRAFT_03405 [Photorhabdus aegyptia]
MEKYTDIERLFHLLFVESTFNEMIAKTRVTIDFYALQLNHLIYYSLVLKKLIIRHSPFC